MKTEYEQLALVKNDHLHRFEMMVGDSRVIIVFEQDNFTIKLLHTEVPPELEGKGAATAIIEKTLEYIEHNHLRLIPLCPFVIAYIKRHPQWKMLLDASVTHL
ncbi:MAG: N-acetyltransferase [Bacteroidetes bacterium]|nr:N-acetyltransferase [Bacteroidota bacterium]